MFSHASFPSTRMRRNRSDAQTRALVAEHRLCVDDLIMPLFIHGTSGIHEIQSMPGTVRHDAKSLLKIAESCAEKKIPAIALFPLIDDALKTGDASEAFNPKGLIPATIRQIKKNFPHLLVITDIALDPYTVHGQDGLINEDGRILNDETVAVLKQQAACHAEAGADIVAPSDMMDGRIGAIRRALDDRAFINTKILAYSAKYASAFYGPFRDAVGSKKLLGKADKKTYQMNPANVHEALHEVALDLEEGADFVMVKPGLMYLDVLHRVKETFKVPTFAYHVSGEYAMLKAAAQNRWIDEKPCVLESLLSFKRAGADAILTYYALDAAAWLSSF